MDKVTRAVINKYPIFVITFQPGTDESKVFQHRNCATALSDGKNFKILDPSDSVLIVNPSGTLPTFAAVPQNV